MSDKKTTVTTPVSNKVILRSVYGKVGSKCFVQPTKNQFGQYPSCVRKVSSTGDLILSDADKQILNDPETVFIPENQVIEITDGMELDLRVPKDKAIWDCIKDCPFIAPSRDAKDAQGNNLIDGTMSWSSLQPRYGVAEFYVDRPGIEASKKVSRRKLIHDACTYIFEDDMGAEGRVKHALLLGKRMKNVGDNEVTDYLLSVAEKQPQRVINAYTSSDATLRLLFIEAKAKNVIILKNKLYLYADDTVLGPTDDAVIAFFKNPKNNKIVKMIEKDTYPEYYSDDENDIKTTKDKK